MLQEYKSLWNLRYFIKIFIIKPNISRRIVIPDIYPCIAGLKYHLLANHIRTSHAVEVMAGTKQETQNSITLKGSAQLVSEFFCKYIVQNCLLAVGAHVQSFTVNWQNKIIHKCFRFNSG